VQREFDIFANQAPEHLLGVHQHRIHVEDARLYDLAAAEGQQLVGQGGGAVGRLEDLLGVAAQRVEGRKLIQR
jgi:hypothetical protein